VSVGSSDWCGDVPDPGGIEWRCILKISAWHVGVAAESATASLFARCGFDVSVQYGADQPEYDLMVARDDKVLKVSVKGSQDGAWGLTQSFLQSADYHAAIATWLERHHPKTIFALVQFKEVAITEMPRVYLATPPEIAQRLRDTAKGRGDTILYERHQWGPRAMGAGTIEEIPNRWRFTLERAEEMLVAGG
jgi:hypothetical protein